MGIQLFINPNKNLYLGRLFLAKFPNEGLNISPSKNLARGKYVRMVIFYRLVIRAKPYRPEVISFKSTRILRYNGDVGLTRDVNDSIAVKNLHLTFVRSSFIRSQHSRGK